MGSDTVMSRLNLNYVTWMVTHYARKLGIFGMLGLVIALGCCMFYVMNIIPMQQQQSDAKIKLTTLENQPEKSVLSEYSTKNTSQNKNYADIQHFYKQFPSGESLPKWLRVINENAAKQHLILNHGDYKLTQIKPQKSALKIEKTILNPLSRYEIVLPVTGQYTQIRQFIAQVLQDLPMLALSDLQIRRDNTQSPSVEARLVFVLLLKGESWQ